MIGTDPPLHRDFRQPLQKKFSPSSAEAMAPHIREIITALIDEFIESGAADFARQLTIPLPSLVTGELLDLPADRRVEFQQWATQLVAEGASSEGYRKLSGYVQQLYDSRVAAPGDDIPSFLLELRVGGEKISRTHWVGLVMMRSWLVLTPRPTAPPSSCTSSGPGRTSASSWRPTRTVCPTRSRNCCAGCPRSPITRAA
jgi:cytochrome P450